jgi:hypothetical protein
VTQTRFTVLDETQRHPDLAKQIGWILHRVAPTVKEITTLPLPEEARSRLLPRPAELSGPSRMDRINSVVLHLLFELTQQAARFGATTGPWGQLAVYDVDDFAPFTSRGAA